MNILNFKLAIRNFIKQKQFSAINIIGLAIGLSAFILISLFIKFHLSFDKYNSNIKNIYRVDQSLQVSGNAETYSCTPFPVGPILQNQFPEIKKACRTGFCAEFISVDKEHTYYEFNGIYADSTFFDIFDFNIVKGNAKTALKEPFSIVLTEELAEKYFPGQNPLGRVLKFQTGFNLKVTGIIKKQPDNSTIRPNYIISFSTYSIVMNEKLDEIWDWCMIRTYVLLEDNTNVEKLTAKIERLQFDYHDNEMGKKLKLWPFANIHLKFNDKNDDSGFIYLFGLIAALILILACINFINLSTAYSAARTKEIGIRKISGSHKRNIIWQFLGESMIITFISFILALILAKLFLPSLNSLIGENMQLNLLNDKTFLLFILIVTISTGLISGSFPAFYLSSLSPVNVLKKNSSSDNKKPVLRNILVVFQFVISITLIISTTVIFKEVLLLRSKSLGFNKENILIGYIQLTGENNTARYNALCNDLLSDPRILNITWTHNAPFFRSEFWNVSIEGKPKNEKYQINHNHVDFNYLKTFNIKLIEGRELSEEYASDKNGACLINEKAVKTFGWDSCGAIGKTLENDGIIYKVVGVMADFHQFSVTGPIDPYFISYTTRELSWPNSHAIRIAPKTDALQMKKIITRKFLEYFPDDNIEFNLLDENFDSRNYGGVQSQGILIGIFAMLAICIAAIGLFGLISFIAKQKTKEIGIRKTNGAKIWQVMLLINKDFAKWVAIAFVIACPIAYFAMNKWLQNYAYKTELSWWIFILAGLTAMFIALLTVSWQSWRAARRNPVESLRYE